MDSNWFSDEKWVVMMAANLAKPVEAVVGREA
jgi:hypothetical protein